MNRSNTLTPDYIINGVLDNTKKQLIFNFNKITQLFDLVYLIYYQRRIWLHA